MEFWRITGLGTVFNALYQLGKAYKKTENISKNSLFLGTVTIILLLEILDALTIDWLSDYLGRIYYNRLIGGLIDAIFIGAALRKTKKQLPPKERLLNKLRLVYCLVFFSWYFMYYLCK